MNPARPFSTVVSFGPDVLARMVMAVQRVQDRLRRAAAALEQARIPYAVIGGNAVAAWVAQVDPAAVRNTADVDILISRNDINRVKAALQPAGFIYRHVKSIDKFLDGPRPRHATRYLSFSLARKFVKPTSNLRRI